MRKKKCKQTYVLVDAFPGMPGKAKLLASFASCLTPSVTVAAEAITSVDRRVIYVIYGILRGAGEVLDMCKREGCRFIYVDNAYVNRHRKQMFSLSWCEMQASTIPSPSPLVSPSRALAVLTEEERKCKFRPGDRHVLVCPPSDEIAALTGSGAWLAEVVRSVRASSASVPIRIRTKPRIGAAQVVDRALLEIPGVELSPENTPAMDDVTSSVCVCAYNSRIAVDAALVGVPVHVSPESVARPISQRVEDIADPKPLSPELYAEWCNHLCRMQFTRREIASGAFMSAFPL